MTQPGTGYQPAYQTIASRIADMITTQDLKTGDRLPTEQQLSQQLGVSRTVVREAVKVLVATGQVQARKGSGIYVTKASSPSVVQASIDISLPADPAHIHSLLEFRTLLEVESSRLAASRITHRIVRELEELVARNKEAAEQVNLAAFGETDGPFHLKIAQATQNPFLASSIDKINTLQDWAIAIILSGITPGSLLQAAQQHEAILLAIKNGDEKEAEQAMRTHLTTVRECYELEVRHRLQQNTLNP